MPSFIVSRLDKMLLVFFEKILFQVLLIFYYDEAANPVLFTLLFYKFYLSVYKSFNSFFTSRFHSYCNFYAIVLQILIVFLKKKQVLIVFQLYVFTVIPILTLLFYKF